MSVAAQLLNRGPCERTSAVLYVPLRLPNCLCADGIVHDHIFITDGGEQRLVCLCPDLPQILHRSHWYAGCLAEGQENGVFYMNAAR